MKYADNFSGFTQDKRILLLSLMAIVIGALSTIVAYALIWLIAVISKMVQYDIGRLPVVSREDARHIVGYIGRGSILAAYQKRHEEEQVRERSFW